MDMSLGSSMSSDAAAMDLFASLPPSISQDNSVSPFSESLMEDLFPREDDDDGTNAMFDDTLQLQDATAASTSNATLDLRVDPPTLSGESLLALEHQEQQSQSQGGPLLSASTASVQMLESTSTETPLAGTSSSTSTTTTTATNAQQPAKRGRGRPRKAPNAPTRTKYARITKEEMSDDDGNAFLSAYRPTSSMSRRSEGSSSLSVSTAGKGKEKDSAGQEQLPNEQEEAATTEDRKGKRPAGLMTETRTKSGRMVHKPEVYVPSFEPSFRRRKAPQARASTESQHCSICNQGHSPPSNQIVFCDLCNTPYHQLCHDPPIPNEVLRNRTPSQQTPSPSTWYCHSCELKRSTLFPQLSWEDSVPASQFPLETVNEYLSILPHSNLINMIWRTVQHTPETRLFPPNLPQLVEEDKVRRRQASEARLQMSTATRGASKSPATVTAEPSNKRKRGPATGISYAESEETESSEEDERSLRRKSKTPRLHPKTNEVGVSTSTSALGASGGGGGGNESTPSPSKGNATTQTDDYIPSDEKVRFPTHPEDRPGSMSYFEMLRNALRDINDPEGVPPRRLYEWISEKYNLPDNFRPSAGQALQKAAKKGHFLKTGSLYRINPEHENMKAVKRPVRKNRTSDASQSTTTTSSHQRNISNQTTASSRSNYTSGSNDAGRTALMMEEEPSTDQTETVQDEPSRSTISLEEVIARQNSAGQSSSRTAVISGPSPIINAFEATVPSVISPQMLPAANPHNTYNAGAPNFESRPPPRPHRQSVSFETQTQSYTLASPRNTMMSAPLPAVSQQQGHSQMQYAQTALRPQAQSQRRSSDFGMPAQVPSHGYGSSGDAGIDSMLADLMRQSPAERMGVQSQQLPTMPPTSGPAYMQKQQQHAQQQQMHGYTSAPARSISPPRRHSQAQVLSQGLGQPHQQMQVPGMQSQQLQSSNPSLLQPQAQRPSRLSQQPSPQQQQQQIHQYNARPTYTSNISDPSIFNPVQYTQSNPPNVQSFQPQYSYQNLDPQQRQQQQFQQQPHPPPQQQQQQH